MLSGLKSALSARDSSADADVRACRTDYRDGNGGRPREARPGGGAMQGMPGMR